MHYNNKNRITEPIHLFSFHRKNYMIAYCYYRREWRIFRLSRLEICKVLDESAEQIPIAWSQVPLEKINRQETSLLLSATSSVNSNQQQSSSRNDYPKIIKLSKMEKEAYCRSPLEEKVYHTINRSRNVVKFVVEPCSIPYTYFGKSHYYVPDALVYYKEDVTALIEVKLSGEMNLSVNQAKFQAAKAFAEKKGWNFFVMGIESFSSDSGYEYRHSWGWGEQQEQAKVKKFNPFETPKETAASASSSRSSFTQDNGSYTWMWIVTIMVIIWFLANSY